MRGGRGTTISFVVNSLEFNATPFPLCQTLITEKAPFDTLWNTAINFFEQQDKWLNGPFSDLDAQTIQNELDDKTKVIPLVVIDYYILLTLHIHS